MNWFLNCFKGVAIGAGAIIPGVSSGVICVILGVYEKLLNAVLNTFKNFKENISFLLPILIGGIIGVIIFGNILKYLLFKYPNQVSFTFIGLVLGSIPSLLKQAEKKQRFRLRYIIYLLITFLIGITMVFLEQSVSATSNTEFSFLYLVFAGMCMSIGVIVPGVSSTVILMLLGVYSAYLTSVAELYFPILIPIGIGLCMGAFICMKIMRILLDKFYMQTFYSIIGFTIGSVFVLYPGIAFDINGLISILCFLLGWFITNVLKK